MEVFVYMKVICLGFTVFLRCFKSVFFCFLVVFFYCGRCVASAVPLKLTKMYF